MARQEKSSLAPTERKGITRAQAEVQQDTIIRKPFLPEGISEAAVHEDQERRLATIVDGETGEELLTFDGGDASDDGDDEGGQPDFGDGSGRPWTENDAPRLSDEELGIPQAPIHPIELPTRRDYTIATQALQFRKTELERLAKKAEEAGYPREARAIKGDAAAINEVILPQFRPQIEMQLVTPGELNFGIKNALMPLVRKFATRCAKAGDARADVEEAESAMLDQLSIKIGNFGRDIAERAFTAGVAYREAEPSALAQQSMESLQGTGVA